MEILHLQTAIDGHNSIKLAAVINGQFVGTAEVYGLPNDPYLGGVYVHEDYRRQGITTAMLKRALNLVEQTGTHATSLVVRNDNEAAINCYTTVGFRRYQDIPDMPGFSQWAYWYNR